MAQNAASAKKRKPKSNPHNCFQEIDKHLEEHNAQLDLAFKIDFKTGDVSEFPKVQLVKIDTKKRKPLPPLYCTYCPFCGKKIRDDRTGKAAS